MAKRKPTVLRVGKGERDYNLGVIVSQFYLSFAQHVKAAQMPILRQIIVSLQPFPI